ncbi:MAG: hypothetical protein OWQ57_08895 [Sulfobacillus sp.]|nr:hypothetical protein [Sulfobacillus sp.]
MKGLKLKPRWEQQIFFDPPGWDPESWHTLSQQWPLVGLRPLPPARRERRWHDPCTWRRGGS